MIDTKQVYRRRVRNQSSAWLQSVVPPLRRDAAGRADVLLYRCIAVIRAELFRRGIKVRV